MSSIYLGHAPELPPLVIGATGGSGTRVVAAIVRRAGYFIGTNLNASLDSMEFPAMYDRWINRFQLRKLAPLCEEEDALMTGDFAECVNRHVSTMPAGQRLWAWKEPRSILLLPFLDERLPAVRFIHVIRDGRDMAFSANQNQLRKHGAAVLKGTLGEAPQPVRSAAVWARVNTAAASYGQERMSGRYMRVSYEALCSEPLPVVRQILDFLGVNGPLPLAEFAAEVSPPDSIGRWSAMGDDATINAMYSAAGYALREFGYI
jgi:hypothetical protein